MMRILAVVFVILINSLFANTYSDLVSLYRTYGLDAVKKELDKQLQTREYWDYYLQDKDVSNGYYESIRYVMICQKDMKNMEVFDTKKHTKLFSSDVFTGKVNGDKQKEGDLKTPVGAYKLTNRLTKLDPFYGPLALTTNYPNLYDKALGKTGHGIWIHGLPTKEERDDFTRGCIALDNNKIKTLDKQINIDNSMLIISENNFNKVEKNDISTILTNIFRWKNAWKYSDFDNYIKYYNQNFKKSNGTDLKKFKAHKLRLFERNEAKKIIFSNINVIPYPNESNKKLYKVVMDEDYSTKRFKFVGKKELYLEVVGDQISILTES